MQLSVVTSYVNIKKKEGGLYFHLVTDLQDQLQGRAIVLVLALSI